MQRTGQNDSVHASNIHMDKQYAYGQRAMQSKTNNNTKRLRSLSQMSVNSQNLPHRIPMVVQRTLSCSGACPDNYKFITTIRSTIVADWPDCWSTGRASNPTPGA